MQDFKFKFEKPEGKLVRPIEDDAVDFKRIADILRKSLGWEFTKQFGNEFETVCIFQKDGIEIWLYYDTMEGMHLNADDDMFDLETLFNEVNTHLKKEDDE